VKGYPFSYHRVITLGTGEDSPALIAPVVDEWHDMHVPLLTFEQLRDHWQALADNDRGNGEWSGGPRQEGTVLVLEEPGVKPLMWLPEPSDQPHPDLDELVYRVDGLGWTDGKVTAPLMGEMWALGYHSQRECGCWPHRLRTTAMGMTCLAEDQGYCNFECPHEEQESA
jgi:hypothetical protein